MNSAHRYAIVLVTAPSLTAARKLVRLALEARLAACGNLIPKIQSHYWWRGRIETSSEVLILFKTTTALLGRLEKLVLVNHPYDTPEMIALALNRGTPRYLAWLLESLKST